MVTVPLSSEQQPMFLSHHDYNVSCVSLSGQYMYSLSHSKPRRLQWTWLGHAEIQFGCSTLHVSTLQMFILLQFNKHQVSLLAHTHAHTHAHTCPLRLDSRCFQEVRVDALLEETGLSAAMLLHALQLLTDKGGPLTCSRPDDPTQGASLPPQRRLSSSPSWSSLLPLSVLRGTEAQSAGGS